MLKQKIKKMVPKSLLKAARPLYHGIIARSAGSGGLRTDIHGRTSIVVRIAHSPNRSGHGTLLADQMHPLSSKTCA